MLTDSPVRQAPQTQPRKARHLASPSPAACYLNSRQRYRLLVRGWGVVTRHPTPDAIRRNGLPKVRWGDQARQHPKLDIHFREQAALLDMQILALTKHVHKDVVASNSELRGVGNLSGSQLAMYEMDRLPGQNYITAKPSLKRDQRPTTVYSLASFFAHSWQSGTPGDSRFVDMSRIITECYARFEYLAGALPERFLPAVIKVRAALPALLDGCYPVVLTHSDLNEMNILVDSSTGKMTGVVDWPGASILPFGIALYALEIALGSMASDRWGYFDNADDLKHAFWRVFREQTGLAEPQTTLIKLAGKAGILIRYGTAYDSNFPGMIGVRDPNAENLRYPDAFLH